MMVLIPILFTAVVINVCLHTSLGSFWYTLEAMYSDENGIQFAQSMIYTYQQELWENNWGQGGHTDVNGEINRSDEMRAYLKESVEQRLRDEKRRRDLVTGISHDLRTPLTSITGYLEGLMDGIADTPEKRMRYLQAIKIRTGNLVSLVDSLSEYCRLDNGFRYRMVETDFKKFVEQYLETCRHDAEQNNVTMEFIYGNETYPVQIDREELKRVFDNLFTNTVKYRNSEKSHILISLKRTLTGTDIELVFKDDGPGVPKDSLEQIFDSFYRVDDARAQSEQGSGIGLAVVKEIILGHGGSIHAENRKGLAIIIHLPIAGEDIDGKNTDRGRR